MDLLLLGGTAFLGRAVASEAMSRGHRVTCLARGSAPPPEGADLVRGDRDAEDGLDGVRGRRWDVVVDVTRHPGHARRAVADLDATHWVLVSSGNAYLHFDAPEQDEQSPVHEPLAADVLDDMEQYGPAKVACEDAVRGADGTATVVRSGLITGPGDVAGRVGYYPWRCAHPTGDDVLVPPDLDFPAALIDVDDLAAWVVLAAEQRLDGTFNVTGPSTTVGAVLEAARRVAGSDVSFTPVPEGVVAQSGIAAWMGPRSLPLWIDDPQWRWFATLETTRAREHGLRTRPLEETLARCLAYEELRGGPSGAGLSDDDEREVRALLAQAR
ncbi:MAG: NAD-dependent epimerase/dehydratase family protein [Nocardioides sp.]|uniref:NAD-dependent epimerase/dehydratase family protein n=1 Tax=Nocardioides sp. TaxID=35761 RepID=UPI003F00F5E8